MLNWYLWFFKRNAWIIKNYQKFVAKYNIYISECIIHVYIPYNYIDVPYEQRNVSVIFTRCVGLQSYAIQIRICHANPCMHHSSSNISFTCKIISIVISCFSFLLG